MLTSFGNQLAEDLFFDKKSRTTRRFPQYLRRIARRKLLYLHEATLLSDLKVPPGNRLEALRGDFKGYHSVRINDQWRLVFRWKNGSAENVQIVDCH
jgi:proteic killer suppression protein